MSSENPTSADNQQETRYATLNPWWVAGFVDGEGCFSVSIHRNELARPTGGWHLQPTFQVSQHVDSVDVLESLVRFLGCGKVRLKGPNSKVAVYVVHSTKQLEARILPFFEQYELHIKRDDFHRFSDIVKSVRNRRHHRPEEFNRLVHVAYAMNAHGKQRKRPIESILLGSSETTREAC